MSFDPEPAVPEPQISSTETEPDESLAPGEKLEVASSEDREWRQRREDLAPAIYDSELRPEPGRDWDERVDPAFSMAEPAPVEEMSPDLRLVPDGVPSSDTAQWFAALPGRLTENYKSLCQSAALIALGAAMALLAVGFIHRHSPLPAGLQTHRPETVRPQPSPTSPQDAAKRLANSKKEANLVPLKPTAGMKIVPGIRLASERVAAERQHRPDFSSERDFVARDTVTRYGAQGVPAPK